MNNTTDAVEALATCSPPSLTPDRLGATACSRSSVIRGDCRTVLADMPADSVQCCVTSPPYWGLRDYGHADQIGLEATPEAFVEMLTGVFREVRRVMKANGTLWLNMGDTYNNRRRLRSTSHQPSLNGRVAERIGRSAWMIELNDEYANLCENALITHERGPKPQ